MKRLALAVSLVVLAGAVAVPIAAGARSGGLATTPGPPAPAAQALTPSATGWTIVGWNNLGMHCMDADFSVLSLLPPYNTIHAQVVDNTGHLVTSPAGITVTYEAVADTRGSINTTSVGKTNFWQYVGALYGASPSPDMGLAGYAMPGASNTPQPMGWDAQSGWFIAEGIPITPYDDSANHNPYPMMKLVARDGSNNILASTNIVLPVSDEMDCTACHASSANYLPARPAAGWVNDANPQRDYRLNILRLHDDRNTGKTLYNQALAARGYNGSGLYATVVSDSKPILCAACHLSNALPGTGYVGVPALTSAIHALHGAVTDPTSGLTLDATANRSACYRCHPGSTTRCLRGVMGRAVAADGTFAIQCQDCHGSMSIVGSPARAGWLNEPTCQSCHTGTAVNNNGLIRYTSAFVTAGQWRVATDQTFATNPNTPAAGLSLYRFSKGHGNVKCEACHGSTHAETPSHEPNDNVQAVALQGHKGVLSECASCHGGSPSATNLGPHGMHPVGQTWVSRHPDFAETNGTSACRDCHGTDYHGTVLSRSLGDRTLSTEFGTKNFWQGFQIGCYTCHKGPDSEKSNPNRAPKATSASAASTGSPVQIALKATDADGDPLTLRIVSQPQHGNAGLSGTTATYYPDSGSVGTDSFTFAAWDGQTDSNLGTVTIGTSPQGNHPLVTTVKATTGPFKITITGQNFEPALQVFINGTPWTGVKVKSATKLVIKKGSALQALFPADTFVPILLLNPGSGLDTEIEFNATTNQWRLIH